MILTESVRVRVGSKNLRHWKNLGYDVKLRQIVEVKVSELPNGCNVKVSLLCHLCRNTYTAWYQNVAVKDRTGEHQCYPCSRTTANHTRTSAAARSRLKEKHPRWKAGKAPFLEYSRLARRLTEETYRLYKHQINPDDLPRTRCGVLGGYQLDHKKSVLKCFEEGLSAETCASVENLQMLSWQDNLAKSSH